MRRSKKPVHNCYSCLLNLGDHCWRYEYPRGQWRGNSRCPSFENERDYDEYRRWLKQPNIKTRKELRREYFRTKPRTTIRRTRGGEARPRT